MTPHDHDHAGPEAPGGSGTGASWCPRCGRDTDDSSRPCGICTVLDPDPPAPRPLLLEVLDDPGVRVWGTILVVLLTALALLGGCGTPARGTVVGRDHTDAWPEMYSYCFGTQPGAQCWTNVRWWPETWLIELDDGQDSGWRTVTQAEHDACPPGTTWPDCAQGRQP